MNTKELAIVIFVINFAQTIWCEGWEGNDFVREGPTSFEIPRFYSSRFVKTPMARLIGRRDFVYCGRNESVCSDPVKNPAGGNTCCWNRICVDTCHDSRNCGSCGKVCSFGMACCSGRCVDLNSNAYHCGSCYHQCPQGRKCAFGMCDYTTSEEDEEDGLYMTGALAL